MQKKIEELAAGKCYRKVSLLQCIPEKLEIELLEGAVYSGEFTIKSSEGIPITGKVCATSLRNLQTILMISPPIQTGNIPPCANASPNTLAPIMKISSWATAPPS